MKKIVSAALALMLATTTLASATDNYSDQSDAEISTENCQKFVLIKKIELPNFSHIICPDLSESNPEQIPDETPEETPNEVPDETPEETPVDVPDETPEETPVDVPDETPDNTPQQQPDNSLSDYAAEVVRLVNVERAKNGLGALSVDSGVQAAAQVRAAEQAKVFSHTRPNGSSCFTALTEQGVTYRAAGENIAYGQQTPEAVMNAWMNSAGHRANILGSQFTKIGVGYTVINGTPYWAQMFIS